MGTIEPGNYCYRRRILSFLKTDEESWIEEMGARYNRVCEHPLKESQIESWRDSFRTLQFALGNLPPSFGKLMIVFEYCLPRIVINGKVIMKRPDVTIVGKDTILLMEFKSDSHFEQGACRQVRGYRRQIKKYQIQSQGKSKKCVAVFTDKQNYRMDDYRVIRCSPDRLTEIMLALFGERPAHLTKQEEKDWLCSDFHPVPMVKEANDHTQEPKITER